MNNHIVYGIAIVIAIVLLILYIKNRVGSHTIQTIADITAIAAFMAVAAVAFYVYFQQVPGESEPALTPTPAETNTATPETVTPPPSSTPDTLSPIPTDTPTSLPPVAFPSYHYLSLESAGVPADALIPINLPTGLQTLAGMPFRIRSEAIITQCDFRPSGINNYSILANTTRPQAVHFLMSGTAVQQIFSGKEVGTITLHFSSGRSESTPLIAGFNIRNWALDRYPDIDIATTTSPDVKEAWRETVSLPAENRDVTGTWDKLAITIPDHLANDTLTRIEISDTSQGTVKDLNPCIYIAAITVEYSAD